MKRPFRTFLGVDLGGGKGKSTAVARLVLRDDGTLEVVDVRPHAAAGQPWYDEALTDYLGEHADNAVVAVDAPLTLTACVRCAEPVCPGLAVCVDPTIVWFRTKGAELVESATADRDRIVAIPSGRNGRSAAPLVPPAQKPHATPYTQRATEVVLHRRHHIIPRETLGQGMGPLTARAAHLVRALGRFGYVRTKNLIEVFPRATIHKLWGADMARRYKRDADPWHTRAFLLEKLRDEVEFARGSGFARETVMSNDHCFDAVICAYTAYLWARDGWTLPEEDRAVFEADGWIFAPGVTGSSDRLP
jgi:predicted RNase H-like nuclease